GARNLALSIFKAMRDSSSPAAPRNDTQTGVITQTPSGEGGLPSVILSPLFFRGRRIPAVALGVTNCGDPSSSANKNGGLLRMTILKPDAQTLLHPQTRPYYSLV